MDETDEVKELHWFDWVIILVVTFFAMRGFKTGFFVQMFDLAGTVFALFLAFNFFEAVSKFLQIWLRVSVSLTNLLGFLLICLTTSGTVSLLARAWQKREKGPMLMAFDQWGGAVFAALKSLIIIAICLVFVTSLPGGKWFEKSGLAQDILHLTPFFYGQFEKNLPSTMPRLLFTPEGMQIGKIDMNRIARGRCVRCGSPVNPEGYERRGLTFIPRLKCTGCGLTSDGCLTFEGYHLFYNECPFEAFIAGKKIECRFWPGQVVEIKGPCPVCKEKKF